MIKNVEKGRKMTIKPIKRKGVSSKIVTHLCIEIEKNLSRIF